MGVFEVVDLPRQVARVHVTKAISASDLRRLEQHVNRRIRRLLHLVVAVKCGDMPRNIRRDAGDKCGQAFEFVARAVEARNEQRDDLDPKLHRMEAPNRVEDRLDTASKLAVERRIKALEINLVEVNPWAQVVEYLRRAVTIGDEPSDQTGPSSLLEDRDRPLACNQRLL